ncbi:MAG TPA: hypothetical protein VG389_00705 [Myxococcota bacterium]|jgi:hypothetical protein|nr:hypothetical protein [Myxococcota bacterium]
MRHAWRLGRLGAVLALVATLWACYRTTLVPGAEVKRLRELTTVPEVKLVAGDGSVTVDRNTELTLRAADGSSVLVVPGGLSYGDSALKLGAAGDPSARVIPYGSIVQLSVQQFSIGRTLGLTIPLAVAAAYIAVLVAGLCLGGALGC